MSARDTVGVPVALLILCALTLGVSQLNTPLFLWLNHTASLLPDALWANLTLFGDALVTLTLLSLLAARHPRLFPAGLLGGFFTTLATRGLKPLLAFERPLTELGTQAHVIGIPLHHQSFPSGHATAIFLLAGVYALTLQNQRLTALLFILALLVGFSRIAVGAHWPLDVLGGAVFGWAGAWIGHTLTQRWKWTTALKTRRILAVLFLLLSLGLFLLDSGYPQSLWLQRGIAGLTLLTSLLAIRRAWKPAA